MGNQGIINAKWRRFAEFIATGHTASDAYLRAGYKSSHRHAAETSASRLRRRPEVAAYISELRHSLDQTAREDTLLSLSETLRLLTRIVRTSATTLPEDDELVEYTRTFKDGGTAVRMPDKLRALKLHAELAGHFDRPAAAPQPPAPSSLDPLPAILSTLRHTLRTSPLPSDTAPDTATPQTSPPPHSPLEKTKKTNHYSPFPAGNIPGPSSAGPATAGSAASTAPAGSPPLPWPADPVCRSLLGTPPRP